MKAIKQKSQNKQQIKLTIILLVVIFGLIAGLLLIRQTISPFKKAAPMCIKNGICKWTAVEGAIRYRYRIAGGTELLTGETTFTQVEFPGVIDGTYSCYVDAVFPNGSNCQASGSATKYCPIGEQPPTPTPPIISTPTPGPSSTPMPSTTPAPNCYFLQCPDLKEGASCPNLPNHICHDVGGGNGKRCVRYPDSACQPDDEMCWCTIQPTNIPTPTPTLIITSTPGPSPTAGPSATPAPSSTPMPTTTPHPKCYVNTCSSNSDCLSIGSSYVCRDVGGSYGKRCVRYPDSACQPDDELCWCTIQPTNIPTSTPTPSPTSKPGPSSTPSPSLTPGPTTTGISPTPTDIIVVNATNTPTPVGATSTMETNSTNPTAAVTTIPQVGPSILPALFLVILGLTAIIIPLFL